MVWVPKARIAFLNDPAMAATVTDPNSATRIAIQAIMNALIEAALEADPALAAQILQAATVKVDEVIANRNLVQAVVTDADGEAVAALVDAQGSLFPGAQWDGYGLPTEGMIATFENKGLVRADTAVTAAKRMVDAIGQNTWFSVAEDGGYDHTTQTYLRNKEHVSFSYDPPHVYPGNTVIWVDLADLSVHRLEN